MSVSPAVLIVIAAMATVTYATRAAGLWLARRFQPSPRVEAALRHIPGAVLVSIVAPLVLSGGPAELIAAGVAAAVMIGHRQPADGGAGRCRRGLGPAPGAGRVG